MKVNFDTHLKIAGIGMVPWTRLGPERWFPDYKIAAYQDWDIDDPHAPEVVTAGTALQLETVNTQSLLAEPEFQDVLRKKLAGYNILTYKPVRQPGALGDFAFLSSNQQLAKQLENKAAFRELMRPLGIPFAPYAIYGSNEELAGADYANLLREGTGFVLQDAQLSGGKGTRIIRDELSYQRAITEISHVGGSGTFVVSELIPDARERSIQGCVTQYGVFTGPLQKQIVADPVLSNLTVPDGDRFCGAEIGFADECADAYPEMERYAKQIGEKAQQLGYKGIFGIDFLIDKQGRVYVLEMNPRITGVTPLLTMMYREDRDIPFYLLHILELANQPYTITDYSVDSTPAPGSLLVLHAQSRAAGRLTDAPRSGFYAGESMQFAASAFRLNPSSTSPETLVQQYMPKDSVIKPGGRIATLFTNQPVLTPEDTLKESMIMRVRSVANKVELDFNYKK